MNKSTSVADASHLDHPQYRADIDGLRAIAVLSVVGYHAFPFLVKGGFIGVDVFFVISGFLISTIIIGSLERNTFSFVEFYSRRIKRIFPALLVVLIACFGFGWVSLLSDEYKQLGKHIAGGAGFISNVLFLNERGYFDNAAETKPLLHLWSLGIEEQFYIIWPLLLWFAWKRRLNLLTIALAVGVISFMLNVDKVRTDTVAAFYSPHTRFWEMMAGSVLAYMTSHKQNMFPMFKQHWRDTRLGHMLCAYAPASTDKTLHNVQSVFGAALIAIGVLVISRERHFPGWWAILPTVGAMLIISAGAQAWVNRVILSYRVLVWIGLISFPLYLWHWPLLSFARIVEGETPTSGIRIAAAIISIVLAWLTYTLIEKPIRVRGYSKTKTVTLVLFMIIVAYVGYYTYTNDGFGFRVQEFEPIIKAAGEWQYPGALKEFQYKTRTFFYQESGKPQTTLFVGDSNVEQYYVRVDELIKTHPLDTNSIIFATGGGCLPIKAAPHDEPHTHCFGLMEDALEMALARKEITTVVIAGQWNGYLSAGFGLVGKFGYGSEEYQMLLSHLSDYIQELKRHNKTVFIVLNIPKGNKLDPKYMAQRGFHSFSTFFLLRNGGISRTTLSETYGPIQEDLQRVASTSGAIVINPLNFLCTNDFCASVDDRGEPIYKDNSHLRPSYVRKNVRFIDPSVLLNN
jgi:peptidoglycan/LPS O-acetylase OafA/YrhL